MQKIASWNVNSLRVRLPHVLSWLQQHQPTVLGLQETKVIDADFPRQALAQAGYHLAYAGQRTYNGVALVSRDPIEHVVTDLPGLDDPQRRVVVATVGDIRVLNLYVPNGSQIDSDKYTYKLRWLAALQHYVKQQLVQYPKLLVMGDFNIAPEDRDVHDPLAWQGHILVSPAERQAFAKLLALGLSDAFRLFPHVAQRYSWWDYRAVAFRRNRGLRIDHILVSEALKGSCQHCDIDIEPRKLTRPSDHAPVFATFK